MCISMRQNIKMCDIFHTKHLFKITNFGNESSFISLLVLNWPTHFLISYWLYIQIYKDSFDAMIAMNTFLAYRVTRGITVICIHVLDYSYEINPKNFIYFINQLLYYECRYFSSRKRFNAKMIHPCGVQPQMTNKALNFIFS